jgi:hypothetical protein
MASSVPKPEHLDGSADVRFGTHMSGTFCTFSHLRRLNSMQLLLTDDWLTSSGCLICPNIKSYTIRLPRHNHEINFICRDRTYPDLTRARKRSTTRPLFIDSPSIHRLVESGQ